MKTAIYEVTVTREVEQEEATVVVRSTSAMAARKKALGIVTRNPDQWFGPLDKGVVVAANAEKLDYEPDCEVL